MNPLTASLNRIHNMLDKTPAAVSGPAMIASRCHRSGVLSLLLILIMVVSGCSSTGSVHDPLEPLNRRVHQFNQILDDAILRPVASAYVGITPSPVQTGVSNFYDNLGYPLVVVNQFLQGKFWLGLRDTGRFAVNTTLGLLGLFDPARRLGLDAHEEDFGQTLAVWGFGRGPYIVVPLLGPTTLRDGTGDVIHTNTTYLPLYINDIPVRNSIIGISFLDTRARLLDSEDIVFGDRYLFIRDAYLQRRDFLISDGQSEEDPFLD